mgnify:CR=1 FL=1
MKAKVENNRVTFVNENFTSSMQQGEITTCTGKKLTYRWFGYPCHGEIAEKIVTVHDEKGRELVRLTVESKEPWT